MAVLRISSCVFVLALVAVATALDNSENAGVRVALKVYDDCSKAEDGFSPCLKKKAITFMERLSKMDKFTIAEGISIVRAGDVPALENTLTEEQLEKSLPRAADAKDAALNTMLMDKVSSFISSRSLQITMPKISANDIMFEGRGKKKGGMMMGGMMMGIAAKMAALVPIAIAGLYLLAGKALIISKIALLIAGIIALKKLVASKHGGGGGGGGGGHGGGWQSGGGGWQSSGGGWDKRSFNEAHKLAYNAYATR